MPLRIVEHPRAARQTEELACYIARDSLDAASRFIDAVSESYRFLVDFPASGEKLATRKAPLRGSRAWQVPGFPNHLVLFRENGDLLEILAVIHGARSITRLAKELSEQDPPPDQPQANT